jgi:UDP-N-acetylglucosamine transferase subunit ALG13
LGHVTRIDSICNRPEFVNTEFNFVLKDINKAAYIAKANKRNVYAAPHFTHSPPQYSSPNYAHIMLRCGWQNTKCAYDLVLSWLQTLEKLKPEIVFIDYAPTAAIAAKLLNIPFLFLGNGFEFPPAEYPFPSILPNQKVTHKELINWHNQLQETLDLVCKKISKSQRPFNLKDIFQSQHGLIIAHPMLDHYIGRKTKVHFLPILAEIDSDDISPSSFEVKPSIFIYLHADTPNLLESLRVLSKDFNIEGYIPNLPSAQLNALRFIGINISAKPVQVSKIMAKCQLIICHCGIGTVGHAIALAKPLILIPTQIEQSLLAHHLCLLGAAVSIPKTVSSKQFVSTVKAVSDNREVMQNNIQVHRHESWDKSLVWKKDINAYIEAFS